MPSTVESEGGLDEQIKDKTMSPNSQRKEEYMSMNEFKVKLEKLGVTPRNLPFAVAVHEGLGLGILVGSWSLCYFTEPTRRLFDLSILQNYKSANMTNAINNAQGKLEKWSKYIPVAKNANKPRLLTSLAESIFFRKASWPVLVPLKIWLSYKIVLSLRQ